MGAPTLLGRPAAGLAPPKPVRIMTKCATVDEFVHTFRRLVDERSIFVLMKTPRPLGPPLRFVIQLADGTTVITGIGAILESRPASASVSQPGMRLELAGLDEASRALHQRLLGARSALLATRTPAAPPPVPKAPPAVRRAATDLGDAALADPITTVDAMAPLLAPPPPEPPLSPGAAAAPALAPSATPAASPLPGLLPRAATPLPGAELRTPGAAFTLPANPFGELPSETLEAFVECSIYEDSGIFPALDQLESAMAPEITSAAPMLASTAAPPSTADLTGMPPFGGSPSPVSAMGTPLPAPVPTSAPMIMPPIDTIAPPPARHGLMLLIVGITLAVGLGGGYLLGARGRDDRAPAPAPAAAKAPALRPAAPASEPPAAAPPKAAPAEPTAAPVDGPGAASAPLDDEAPVVAKEPVAAKSPAGGQPLEPAGPTAAAPKVMPAAGYCVVTLYTMPPGAKVTAGTKVLGVTPVENATLPCGAQAVVLEHPRYARIDRNVTLASGNVTIVDEQLMRPEGVLSLASTPAGARFTVDGVAATPGGHKVLAYTFVSVTATLPGYKAWSQKIYVRGRQARASATLEALPKAKPKGKPAAPPKPGPPIKPTGTR